MVQYNESIYFDRAFYAQDIAGSIAYARANIATGILTEAEFKKIEAGLLQVKREWDQGTFQIKPGVDEGKRFKRPLEAWLTPLNTYTLPMRDDLVRLLVRA